jgi:hypothetical protein
MLAEACVGTALEMPKKTFMSAVALCSTVMTMTY